MILLFDVMFVLYGAVVFTAIILLLAVGLLVAQKKLVPQGDVKIIVNGDTENPIIVQPGGSLLSTLSNKNMFLPSTFGVGCTDDMCKCPVDTGGGG